MVDAYEYATGHRVTSDNTEPRMAITKVNMELLDSRVPKSFVSIDIAHLQIWFARVSIACVARKDCSQCSHQMCESSRGIRAGRFENQQLEKYILCFTCLKDEGNVYYQWKRYRIGTKSDAMPSKTPNTLKLPNVKEANNPGVDTSMKVLDNIWKTMVATGNIVLPKLFGEVAHSLYWNHYTTHAICSSSLCTKTRTAKCRSAEGNRMHLGL